MSANIQIDLFNQNLVQEKNGELLVSSITIAENVGYEHNAVIRLIRDNIKDFKNIEFEINNPYIPPITKSKKSKRKIITYKTKDLITGEDTFLIQDIKTKKYKVNKNPNVLDKPKKYTGRNLSEMYFDFTNKEEY